MSAVYLQVWKLLKSKATQSCQSSKITISCWTTINRRMLELTKKDIPCPETKKKPQLDGMRGTIMIKTNPIPSGWVTHKLENNNTKEVLPLLWRFGTPCQASQPGDLTKGLGIPRESDFVGQWDLITKFPQDWGTRDSSLGGWKQNLACTKTQRKG